MSAHLAVAIVAATSSDALAQARSLPAAVSLVEYRLDSMDEVDVARLAHQSPIPAILTCRPQTQGGHFAGSERERLTILRQALATNALVDIEMTTLPALADAITRPQRIIGSHHDFSGMLGDWNSLEEHIGAMGAGIIKLVGMAATEADTLTPLAWLARTPRRAIGIAMGAAGLATRLLAPRFPRAFLTFASLQTASAPGQLPVQELIEAYGFFRIAQAEPLWVLLTPSPPPWPQVQAYRQALRNDSAWLLPIPVTQVNAGLMLALRLARVHGVMRMPAVPTTPDLSAYGFAPQAHAWELRPSGRFSLEPLSPTTFIAFFTQQGKF